MSVARTCVTHTLTHTHKQCPELKTSPLKARDRGRCTIQVVGTTKLRAHHTSLPWQQERRRSISITVEHDTELTDIRKTEGGCSCLRWEWVKEGGKTIQRERERERQTHTHTHTYYKTDIYICIYNDMKTYQWGWVGCTVL